MLLLAAAIRNDINKAYTLTVQGPERSTHNVHVWQSVPQDQIASLQPREYGRGTKVQDFSRSVVQQAELPVSILLGVMTRPNQHYLLVNKYTPEPCWFTFTAKTSKTRTATLNKELHAHFCFCDVPACPKKKAFGKRIAPLEGSTVHNTFSF